MLFLPLLLAAGCQGDDKPADAAPATCEELLADGQPPASEADIAALLGVVRGAFFPQFADTTIDLLSQETDDATFFSAAVDVATLEEPGLERDYRVIYNPLLFDDPPPYDAVGAILVHELKHVQDYAEMSSEELVNHALWYAQGDVSAYERATDEHALECGCGLGLIAFREWLYDHVTPEVEAQKREDYYTPEEIEAWMAANP